MSGVSAAIDGVELVLAGSDSDAKVHALQALQSELDTGFLNGGTADVNDLHRINNTLKHALRATNHRVATAALACCTRFFARIADAVHSEQLHDASAFVASSIEALLFSSSVITLLGDAKDATRVAARALLVQASITALIFDAHSATLATHIYADVETFIKDHVLLSKNARTREQGVLCLAELRRLYPTLPFKSWTPTLVTLLTDADGLVREAAKDSVVIIYGHPSTVPAARSDFKREMLKQSVRKTIADPILQALTGPSELVARSSPTTNGETPPPATAGGRTRSSARLASSSGLPSAAQESDAGTSPSVRASSSKSAPRERLLKQPKNLTQAEILAQIEAEAIAAAAAHSVAATAPVTLTATYIVSEQDVREDFAQLRQCFDGRESEYNWQDRERAIFRLRGMLLGGGHQQYQQTFVRELRQTSECVFKAVNSLRTTLAATACCLIAELAEALHTELSPLLDLYLAGLFKLATLTKRSIAQASQDAADKWLQHCGYSPKTLLLIAELLDQKNNQARLYAAQHMLAVAKYIVTSHESAFVNTGGHTLLQQLLHKALTDASAPVREAARNVLIELYTTWPRLAAAVYDSLDVASRKLVDKARQSAQASMTPDQNETESIRPKAKPRQSVRQMIAAQRSALTTSTSSSPDSSVRSAQAALADVKGGSEHIRTSHGHSSPRERVSMLPSATWMSSGSPRSSAGSSRSPPNKTVAGRTRTASVASSASSRSTPVRRDAAQIRQSMSLSTSRLPSATYDAATHALPPSPTLSTIGVDFSDAEDYSMNIANTAPVPHEPSSEDESMLFATKSPLQRNSRDRDAADISLLGDSSSDDELQRRAKIAEKTAEDFVNGNATKHVDEVGDATIMHEDLKTDQRYDSPLSADKSAGRIPGRVTDTAEDGVTPLLERMRHIHLKDSPAVAPNGSLLSAQSASWSWWAIKGDLQVSRARPVPAEEAPRQEWLQNAMRRLNDASIDLADLLSLTQLSAQVDAASTSTQDPDWQRVCKTALQLVTTSDDRALVEGGLLLLRSLISHQTVNVRDEEATIIHAALHLHQRLPSTPPEAVTAILQCVAENSDQIYALGCIRSGLETLLALLVHDQIAPVQAEVLAGGLASVGLLFANLPTELVEEELPRAQQLLLTCLNSSLPKVRRSAALVIVQANKSLGDPARTFELLKNLTEAQKNFCTYLFRHEG